jgi:hypothetical protein
MSPKSRASSDGRRRDQRDRDRQAADEAVLSARLRRLGERLAIQADRLSGSELDQRPAADPSAIARGFRLSSELPQVSSVAPVSAG